MEHDWLQYTNLVVQTALLGIVTWYTFETSKLRRQSQEELKLLQKQIRLGLAPYLIGEVPAYLRGGQRLEESPLRVIRAQFRCNILNPTDRIAHHVRAVVYDARHGEYFWSHDGIEA